MTSSQITSSSFLCALSCCLILLIPLTWQLTGAEEIHIDHANLITLDFDDVDKLMKENQGASSKEQLESVRDWYLELAPFKARKSRPIEKFIQLLKLEKSKDDLCQKENERILSNLEFGRRQTIWDLPTIDPLTIGQSPSKKLISHYVKEYNSACSKRAIEDYLKGKEQLTEETLEKIKEFEGTVEEWKDRVYKSPTYEHNRLVILKRENKNLKEYVKFDRKLREACTDFVELMTPVYLPGFPYSLDYMQDALDSRIRDDEASFYACKALIEDGVLL